MKKYIGIDLGGTNVRVAKVTADGEILAEVKSPSYAQDGPSKVMENLIRCIKEIDGWQDCAGIGVGVPGPVDTGRGEMLMATNLPGFVHFPLAKTLEDEFDLPTFVDNDANVAGLAEALVGAGKGLPIVYYVTHSTGIGGALIVDGKVVSGKHGHAGEIGNIIIDRARKKYNHLNVGAVENEVSGTALIRIAKEIVDENITSAGELFALAKSGSPQALDIVDTMAFDFAMMFSAIAHVCDPFAFIVGGGVMKSKDLYFDKMIEYYKQHVHTGMRTVEFKPAMLAEPGLIGAAMLPVSFGK
ncbi:MAG: ROK family protein [Erysipelotrichaceae bacterium]|nr:ROK family protein [Erysipelotrichaceae bacterium]MDP3304450.1 ROK family protein [Erysipelotrichaceae bacterium]